MRTEFIKTAIQLSETGSYARAGQALGLPASNLYHHIQNIENELGFMLFELPPGRKNYVATGQGAKWLAFARRAMEMLDQGTVEMKVKKGCR